MAGAHTARVHGPVRQAAQLAGAKACCPQVGDDGAVCLGDLVVCIDRHAGAQGGNTDVLVDAIEGRGVDALHVAGLLAEVAVEAGIDKLVVALDACDQGVSRNAEGLGELLEGIAAMSVDEVLKHACTRLHRAVHLDIGHIDLELLGVGCPAAPLSHLVDIVCVEDLRVPARLGLITQLVVELLEFCILVHKALAVFVDGEERLVEHGAGVEVMHHVRVAHGHKAGTDGHGHENAVAGLADLLAVKLFDVGAVALDEALVVLIVTRGDDDALRGVELDVFASFGLADNAGHGAGFVLDELDAGSAVIEIDAALLGQLGKGVDKFIVGVRLGPEAVGALRALAAVLILERDLTDAVGREAGLHGTDLHPAHGLAGVVIIEACQTAVGAPVAIFDEALHVVHDALLVAFVEHDARGSAALRKRCAFLLQAAGGCAFLHGRKGRGDAAGAGADDNDVVGILGCKLCDGCQLNR